MIRIRFNGDAAVGQAGVFAVLADGDVCDTAGFILRFQKRPIDRAEATVAGGAYTYAVLFPRFDAQGFAVPGPDQGVAVDGE